MILRRQPSTADLAPLLIDPTDAYGARYSFFVDLVALSSKGRLPPGIRDRLAEVPGTVEAYNRTGAAKPKSMCPRCKTPSELRRHADTGALSAGRALEEALPGARVTAIGISRPACAACPFEIENAGFLFVTDRAAVRRDAFESVDEMMAEAADIEAPAAHWHAGADD